MLLKLVILTHLHMSAYSNQTDELFKIQADEMFKSVIGRDPDRIHETTHKLDIIDDDHNVTIIKRRLLITTKKADSKVKKDNEILEGMGIFEPKSAEEARMRIRDLEIERILNENISSLPNFEKGEDDPAIITRRFDTMREEHKYRRYRGKWDIAKRNIWRNRTLTTILHFVYATRYKLPNSQALRKKYYNSKKYRIGYCFALLRHLKSQQLLMYNQLKTFQFRYSTIDTHLKLYEKVVRLDIDIKDMMKHIRVLERRRVLEENPDYYNEYEDKVGKGAHKKSS